MQTSLARRQRRRRNGSARGSGSGHAASGAAIALPLFLFGTLALLAIVGFGSVVAAYSYYSQGLPDPLPQLNNITFSQETVVYDRTGKIELARFGAIKRTVIPYSAMPPALIDATTSVEDKTFWQNAGFDPIGIISAALDTVTGNARGASTITQQLVRGRLLPSVRLRRLDLRAQDPRDHPVDPPDPGAPARPSRQGADHAGVPEPELLRQPELRDRGGRPELFRDHRPVQARPGPVGDPGGHPPVAVGLRPGPERRRAVQRAGRQRGGLPGRQDRSSSSRRPPRSSSAATTSST